jgi:Na+/proline symporter
MVFGYTVGMLSAVLFLLIGLLIYLFNDPAVMGSTARSAGAFAASEEVYPRLVVEYFPPGLLGLSLAAMLAAVMSSFDSATAAISSTFVADVLRPLKHGFRVLTARDTVSEDNVKPPLRATALTGLILTTSGVAAALLYDPEDSLLVDFALGISSFPLGGMIGVFCTALFTRRGNVRSVAAALIIGPLVWLFVQPELLDLVTVPLLGQSITLETLTSAWFETPVTLAWPWWFSIAAVVSFAVCCSGRPPRR